MPKQFPECKVKEQSEDQTFEKSRHAVVATNSKQSVVGSINRPLRTVRWLYDDVTGWLDGSVTLATVLLDKNPVQLHVTCQTSIQQQDHE